MKVDKLFKIFQQHSSVCTDTRKITEGCLFFALQGSNFDGNTFATEAIKLGAAIAVVSDPALSGAQYFYVEDTLAALQSLAKLYRSTLEIPILAITGSNGKTTTKELVNCALKEKYIVHCTTGNFNNHIGVPLTLLSTPANAEIIVCEMGANHIGDIAALCEIAMPTHGIITNIGSAHLEGFGSIEGVQKGKGELYDYLRLHEGFTFVSTDDLRLRKLGEILNQKTTFGFDKSAAPDILFTYLPSSEKSGFTLMDNKNGVKISSEMFGFYNASNVLAAYTVASHFNVPVSKIIFSLSSFVPGANRSETITFHDCRIIKDAYNANPSSMELSLRAFAQQYPQGWVILGDMMELGNESHQAHFHMIEMAHQLGFQKVFLVGPFFTAAIKDQHHLFSDLVITSGIDELKGMWNWATCNEETILIKGSRSMKLEKLLDD